MWREGTPHVLMGIVSFRKEMCETECKLFYITDAETANWFAMYLIINLR